MIKHGMKLIACWMSLIGGNLGGISLRTTSTYSLRKVLICDRTMASIFHSNINKRHNNEASCNPLSCDLEVRNSNGFKALKVNLNYIFYKGIGGLITIIYSITITLPWAA